VSNFDFAGTARRFLLMLAALTSVAALSACAGRGGKVPYDPVDFKAPDTETIAVSPGQERIGPLDKAGAYAVQAQAALFIERIEGDYWNVVGLPISLVYRLVTGRDG